MPPTKKSDCLDNTKTGKEASSGNANIEKFLQHFRTVTTVKQANRHIGFLRVFLRCFLLFGENILPFYESLRKENALTIGHGERLDKLTSDVEVAMKLTLRLAKPNTQNFFSLTQDFVAANLW